MEWGNAPLPHCPINRNEQQELLIDCSFTLWWV